MRTALCNLALLLAVACAVARSEDETVTVTAETIRRGPPETVELTYPIIQFKELAVPSAGTIQSIVGRVDRFTPHGWLPLRAGDVLEDGTCFQIEPGASAKIVLFSNRVVELSSQQEARGFEVRVLAGE
jgi:hypothetical protein